MALSREIEKSKQHRVYPSKQSIPAITGSRKKANIIEFIRRSNPFHPSEKCCRTSSTMESIEGLAVRDIEDKKLTLAYFLDV